MGSKDFYTTPMGFAKYIRICLLIVLTFPAAILPARSQGNQETQYKQIMDEGVRLMETGNYQDADKKFKQVLRNLEVLPSEICFYFGKNSYFLKEYKQSINWLNKYLELKGTQGQYFDECIAYLNRSEKAFEIQREKDADKVAKEFSRKNEFDCQGHDFFQCPVCKGDGVLLKPGKLDNIIYETCPYCNGSGRISCEDYKKYMRGELTTKED